MCEHSLKQAVEVIKKGSVDLVLCNPPYSKERPASRKNLSLYLAIVCHKIHTSLQEAVTMSMDLLKIDGHLTMVHRSNRSLDILHATENANTTSKKVRLIYPELDKEASVLLTEGTKQGKKDGPRVLPLPFTYNERNEHEAEMKAMFYRE